MIAGSPWLTWDDGKELKALEPFLAGPEVKVRALFLSREGAEMKASLDALTAALRARKDDSLRFGVAMPAPEGMVNELGYQLLHLKELDASIVAFRYNAERDPQSANVWDSLGDGLEGAGKKEQALASYRKAVSVAEASHDPRLENYKKQVARIAEAKKPDQN